MPRSGYCGLTTTMTMMTMIVFFSQGLRRGNPLHLCPERYENLRMLWLSHGLHERIARALDTNMLVTTQWQNM